jgi:hypothetical protein
VTAPVVVNCNDVIHELWDWLDGEMEPARFTAIREHLGICKGCHGHVEFARGFLAHVDEPPSADADLAALRERVQRVLREQRD